MAEPTVQQNRPVVVTQPTGARNVVVPTNGQVAQQPNGGQPQPAAFDRFSGQVTDGSGQVRNFSGNLGNTTGANGNVGTPNVNGNNGVRDAAGNIINQATTPESISRVQSLSENYNIQQLKLVVPLEDGSIGLIYNPDHMAAMFAKAYKENRLDELVSSFEEAAAITQPGKGGIGKQIRPVSDDGSYGPPAASTPTSGIGELFAWIGNLRNPGSVPPFTRNVETFLAMIQTFGSEAGNTTQINNPYFSQLGVTSEDFINAAKKLPDFPGKLTRLTNATKSNLDAINAANAKAAEGITNLRTKINEVKTT
jgi:hypothetical protein